MASLCGCRFVDGVFCFEHLVLCLLDPALLQSARNWLERVESGGGDGDAAHHGVGRLEGAGRVLHDTCHSAWNKSSMRQVQQNWSELLLVTARVT